MAENFFGITHTGRIRDNNEDTFLAEKLSNGWIVACVIDGVGGYEGGEVAAEIARETVRKGLDSFSGDPTHILKNGLLQANNHIYNEKLRNKGKDQMACVMTVALVDIENNQFYYAHVGDTRLYLLRDQSLVKVTKDHSFVGFLEDSGRLSEKEAMAHPKRNEINKALGFDPQVDLKEDYIETGSSPFLPGDMLLLCSDGLSDLVDRRGMTSVLLSTRSLPEKGEALIEAANAAGGKDNITVVIVHNNKKPLKLKATKPLKKNESDEPPIIATPVNAPQIKPEVMPASKRKASLAVPVLSAVCLVLAGACFWLWSQRKNEPDISIQQAAEYLPNEKEKQLSDSLGLATSVFNLQDTAAGNSIIIGDTLFVRQDTLHINGNGVVLQGDTAYKGPALVATNNNKTLLLENITFRNFTTAIALNGRKLFLRNVRFQNCIVPVQRSLYLPADSALNGALQDNFSLNINSLPK